MSRQKGYISFFLLDIKVILADGSSDKKKKKKRKEKKRHGFSEEEKICVESSPDSRSDRHKELKGGRGFSVGEGNGPTGMWEGRD